VLPLLKATDKLAHHFQQSMTLLKHVPMRRLLRRKQHSALGELIQLVENDVAQHAA
jgi:hypothetical protein